MSKQDGGPAFPISYERPINTCFGMTLRDYFAGQALAGYSHQEAYREVPCSHIAGWAYEQADAMLAERDKP